MWFSHCFWIWQVIPVSACTGASGHCSLMCPRGMMSDGELSYPTSELAVLSCCIWWKEGVSGQPHGLPPGADSSFPRGAAGRSEAEQDPCWLLRQLEHSPGSAAVSADFSFDYLFHLEVSNGSQALLHKLPGWSLVRFGLFHSLSFCQPFSPKLIFLLSFFSQSFSVC